MWLVSCMVEVSLSINLREIFTSLTSLNIMKCYSRTVKIPVPPNCTITIERQVSDGMVCLVSEEKYVVDTDNALSIKVTIDGVERMSDDSVVQETYSVPINWMELGAFEPVYRSIVVEITNNTDNLVNMIVTSRYGLLARSFYDSLVRKYFESVVDAIGGGGYEEKMQVLRSSYRG